MSKFSFSILTRLTSGNAFLRLLGKRFSLRLTEEFVRSRGDYGQKFHLNSTLVNIKASSSTVYTYLAYPRSFEAGISTVSRRFDANQNEFGIDGSDCDDLVASGGKYNIRRPEKGWHDDDFFKNEASDDGLLRHFRRKKSFGGPSEASEQEGAMLWSLLRKTRSSESVLPLLEKWIVDDNSICKKTIIIALTSLKRAKRLEQALEIAEWIWREKPFEMVEVDHLYRLYLHGEVSRKIEDVEGCFAEIPKEFQSERVYRQLISCYIARNMEGKARDALGRLVKSGVPVSAAPFNQLMANCKRMDRPDQVFELMQEMKQANVVPSTESYNMLISLKMKCGDVEGVRWLHEDMLSGGVKPDRFTYSLLARAYLAAGSRCEAEAMVHELEGGKASSQTRNLLIALYGEQGKHDELKGLWKGAARRKIRSFRSYAAMIEAMGSLGEVKEAEMLTEKVEKMKGKPSIRIYNALLSVYAKNKMIEEAEKLIEDVISKGLNLNAISYYHLAWGYLQQGELHKSVGILKTSSECLMYPYSKPWFETLVNILDAYARRGEVEGAEHVFQTFTRKNYYRTTELYNKLIGAYVVGRKVPVGLLERMEVDGVVPNNETLSLLDEAQRR